jgi:hypothetical protein
MPKFSNSFTISLLSLAILAVLGWRGVAENETLATRYKYAN